MQWDHVQQVGEGDQAGEYAAFCVDHEEVLFDQQTVHHQAGREDIRTSTRMHFFLWQKRKMQIFNLLFAAIVASFGALTVTLIAREKPEVCAFITVPNNRLPNNRPWCILHADTDNGTFVLAREGVVCDNTCEQKLYDKLTSQGQVLPVHQGRSLQYGNLPDGYPCKFSGINGDQQICYDGKLQSADDPPESDFQKKVICTELFEQGRLPLHIYKADTAFGHTVHPAIHAGYLLWAQYVVKLMRRSSAFTDFVELFARPWAHHMAYKMGVETEDSVLGRALMTVGCPICFVLGKIQETAVICAMTAGMGLAVAVPVMKKVR